MNAHLARTESPSDFRAAQSTACEKTGGTPSPLLKTLKISARTIRLAHEQAYSFTLPD
jgi:hypothetical protein